MIGPLSRYADSTVSLTDSPERGSVLTVMPRRPSTRVFNYTSIYLEDGDRLDLIAERLYGDGALWWKIADANPEILDWSDVPAGTLLRLPSDY